MLENITFEDFQTILGEGIAMKIGDASFAAEIEEVNPMTQQPGQERVPFSVILQAEVEENYGQHVYQLSHQGLGDFELFLVPIGPGQKGMRYEAIFT